MQEPTVNALTQPVDIHSEIGRLHGIDIGIILLYVVLSVAIGVALSRKARTSVASFFTSGGKMPWYLLGTSMIATTFAADTPLALSGFVASSGLSTNWFWWCHAMMTMFGVFFFARLWRRATLSTDMEFVAIRYSGNSSRVLRTFRAVYLSMFYSVIIMGWVNLAMVKVISGILSPMDLRIEWVDKPLAGLLNATGFIGKTPTLEFESSGDARWLEIQRRGEPFMDDAGRVQEHFSTFQITLKGSGSDTVGEINLLDEESPRSIAALREYLAEQYNIESNALGSAALQDRSIIYLAPQRLDLTRGSPRLLTYQEGIAGRLSLLLTAKILFLLFIVTVSYCAISGFWGVVITDFIQFFIAMAGAIYLAWAAIQLFGGMGPLMDYANAAFGSAQTESMLSMIPPGDLPPGAAEEGLIDRDGSFTPMPFEAFIVYIFVFWFAVGFTDGGNMYAQRMIGARSERDAMLAYLWFGVGNFCIRMWPWLLVGLAGVCLFPNLAAQQAIDPGATSYDPEMNYIYTMRVVLGPGLLGIVVASFLAAYMSTISTHLNLSTSYLVNDVYKSELVKNRSEKHYLLVSTLTTLFVAIMGIITTLFLTTIAGAWFLVASLNAGIGIVYLLRWYWWRINAWSELSCMIALFCGTALIQAISWGDAWDRARQDNVPYTGNAPVWFQNVLANDGMVAAASRNLTLNLEWTSEMADVDGNMVPVQRGINFSEFPFSILLLVPLSLMVWLPVTFLTRPAEKEHLKAFYRRVRPGGPGWRKIASECPDIDPRESLLNRGNVACWLMAVCSIYFALFGTRDLFFGPWWRALLLLACAAVFGVLVAKTLQTGEKTPPPPLPGEEENPKDTPQMEEGKHST